MLESFVTNFFSAPVLAFALGILAAAIRSDLKVPEPVTQAISIYLLLAIGLKGEWPCGVCRWSTSRRQPHSQCCSASSSPRPRTGFSG
ncbi:hypothetical protein GCM10025873_08190 [Demequina sediminis]|nr:sodium-dependent bicarbonate transport family permease [Demequina sediminis]BDZ61028.1 hypothetical protein GCM10025873_08190 [Demequina sediminis]